MLNQSNENGFFTMSTIILDVIKNCFNYLKMVSTCWYVNRRSIQRVIMFRALVVMLVGEGQGLLGIEFSFHIGYQWFGFSWPFVEFFILF